MNWIKSWRGKQNKSNKSKIGGGIGCLKDRDAGVDRGYDGETDSPWADMEHFTMSLKSGHDEYSDQDESSDTDRFSYEDNPGILSPVTRKSTFFCQKKRKQD